MTITDEYKILMEYLAENQEKFSLGAKKIKDRFNKNGIEDICEELMDIYIHSRIEKKISNARTIPDNAVSKVMEVYFGKNITDLDRIKVEHQQCMISENIVGELLEKYLASILKDYGWVWCSGEFVKAIDFIKKDGNTWKELQVKNRNNTENSSSSTVRNETDIIKWHRSFSKPSENRNCNTNWENFPDINAKAFLNENDFCNFMESYLLRVKSMSDSENLKKFDILPFIVKDDNIRNIVIYEDITFFITSLSSDLVKTKIIEKFKRNNFTKNWKKAQLKLSEIPNLNKKRIGVTRNIPSLSDINRDLLQGDNLLPPGQVLYLNEGILTNQDVMKCDLYPMKNQDMNGRVISLKIEGNINFYIFSTYDIWIPKDLTYIKLEDESTTLLEVYKVLN